MVGLVDLWDWFGFGLDSLNEVCSPDLGEIVH
jgi:hypothetical protein